MALAEFLAELDAIGGGSAGRFCRGRRWPMRLEEARVEFLGAKSGRLKAVQKGLGPLASDEKPAAGKQFNEIKGPIEAAFAAAQDRLAGGGDVRRRRASRLIAHCRASGRAWGACTR